MRLNKDSREDPLLRPDILPILSPIKVKVDKYCDSTHLNQITVSSLKNNFSYFQGDLTTVLVIKYFYSMGIFIVDFE